MAETPLESILKRDRSVVLAGLIILVVFAWAYLFLQARDMSSMMQYCAVMGREMVMAQAEPWRSGDVAMIFVMWSVMMVAMMVPSASPMLLIFASTNRRRRELHRPFVPTFVFLLGYLVVWTAFSALATLAQWRLHSAALISPMMESTNPVLSGVLLVAAGLFQWSPLKGTCLAHCRSPLAFISTQWQDGMYGAFVMGVRHGLYCLGCCWALMCLLFVMGVMNLLWIAVIAVFVLLEKVVPAQAQFWVGRVAGIVLAVWGVWLLAAS